MEDHRATVAGHSAKSGKSNQSVACWGPQQASQQRHAKPKLASRQQAYINNQYHIGPQREHVTDSAKLGGGPPSYSCGTLCKEQQKQSVRSLLRPPAGIPPTSRKAKTRFRTAGLHHNQYHFGPQREHVTDSAKLGGGPPSYSCGTLCKEQEKQSVRSLLGPPAGIPAQLAGSPSEQRLGSTHTTDAGYRCCVARVLSARCKSSAG
ncbi:hypothetical protein RB12806 [Rhodopirellula baltica SH 1]|uniref:Uncharacterized protein n=1 Tax=Rhodopirellula baltica (strain DSM 10527 / NCIMB 13988 / SH1) TaxID=243090 RepID=Q7UI24_RHOBA|nr:hypothetical protein RB12806 [Rhodopirellula baltica SH 1]